MKDTNIIFFSLSGHLAIHLKPNVKPILSQKWLFGQNFLSREMPSVFKDTFS